MLSEKEKIEEKIFSLLKNENPVGRIEKIAAKIESLTKSGKITAENKIRVSKLYENLAIRLSKIEGNAKDVASAQLVIKTLPPSSDFVIEKNEEFEKMKEDRKILQTTVFKTVTDEKRVSIKEKEAALIEEDTKKDSTKK